MRVSLTALGYRLNLETHHTHRLPNIKRLDLLDRLDVLSRQLDGQRLDVLIEVFDTTTAEDRVAVRVFGERVGEGD